MDAARRGDADGQPAAETAGRGDSAAAAGPAPPACYLIVHSVAKKHNVGTLARSATAFGVEEVLLVGERSFNSFGAHGASDHVAFRHFPSLADALTYPHPCPCPHAEIISADQVRAYLVAKGARILGVEIDDSALSVDAPGVFTGPTAFILGNEGSGLSRAQMAICDGFVYIPQHGPGTASLNVAVAAGIILHRFTSWAQFPERRRVGNKFEVADRPQRTGARGCVPHEDPGEVRAMRAAERAERDEAALEGGAMGWSGEAEDGGDD